MKFILKNIIKRNFKLLESNVKKVSHNTNIMYYNGNYDGYYHCGPMSLCLYNLLKNNYINTKVYKSKIGYGKYIQDHVYLKVNDIIIDPTYLQFLRINNTSFNMIYFSELDPFYVGSLDNLYRLYHHYININNSISKYKLDINDFSFCWQNSINITKYYDDNIKLLT